MVSRLLVVKVKKDSSGDITDVMLDNGEIFPIDEAILKSKEGYIEDIIVEEGKEGKQYYRNHPNHHGNDSFYHLPEF